MGALYSSLGVENGTPMDLGIGYRKKKISGVRGTNIFIFYWRLLRSRKGGLLKMKKNYKMTIAYDGTRYKGWQNQKSTDYTIQGKLNSIFTKLEGEEVVVQGSGRTDAGVHAMGQVANVYLSIDMPVRQIQDYVNLYLPEDIGVMQMEEVPERFHARLSAVRKTYCYRIFNSSIPNVFERKWMHTIVKSLNVQDMQSAAQYLVGTHDFMAFCRNPSKKKSTVRTIYNLEVIRKGEEVDIVVSGDGFLHNMVRIVAGTLVEVGTEKRGPLEVKQILEDGIRENAGAMLPAKGLILQSVEYKT